MWESVIVWLIVGFIAGLALRSLYRTLTGKERGCACSGQTTCPLSRPCGAAQVTSGESAASTGSTPIGPGESEQKSGS
jgi:hypothetical protein